MVPSERSEEAIHTSESSQQRGGLESRLSGDDVDKLRTLFTQEHAPATEEESTEAQLGSVALHEVTDTPESPEGESARALREHPDAVHARELHEEKMQLSRKIEEEMRRFREIELEEASLRTAPSEEPAATLPEPEQALVTSTEEDQVITAVPFNAKQAEKLWGAKDVIRSEDVPKGELTYEQYLALRPKAEEGDVLHRKDKNGRTIVYDALTGHRVKEADYLKQDAHSSFERTYYEQKAVERSIDEAREINEVYDNKVHDELREGAEAIVFIQKDDRLKGLDLLGSELKRLRDSTVNRKLYTPALQQEISARETVFKDLLDLYSTKSLEPRGLHYLESKYLTPYEKPDHVEHKGSAWLGGTKVAIHEVIESPAGDKAYVVQDRNGDRQTVNVAELTFKQEFEVPKASLFDRARKHFKKFVADVQEFGGGAAIGQRWNDAKDWLYNRHLHEEMTPDQIQEQKEKNRRNNRIGAAALIAGGTLAVVGASVLLGTSLHEQLNGELPNSSGGDALGAADSIADTLPADEFREFKASGVDVQPSPEQIEALKLAEAIQNPAYTVPEGEGGIGLFESLKLPESTWRQHAGELVRQFPNEFYYMSDGSVGISNPGPLPTEVRIAIEKLRG